MATHDATPSFRRARVRCAEPDRARRAHRAAAARRARPSISSATTNRRSISGRASCSSIGITIGRARTSTALAARRPSSSANPKRCCIRASPRSRRAMSRARAGSSWMRSTAARLATTRRACSIASSVSAPGRRRHLAARIASAASRARSPDQPRRHASAPRSRGRRGASSRGGRPRRNRRGLWGFALPDPSTLPFLGAAAADRRRWSVTPRRAAAAAGRE